MLKYFFPIINQLLIISYYLLFFLLFLLLLIIHYLLITDVLHYFKIFEKLQGRMVIFLHFFFHVYFFNPS